MLEVFVYNAGKGDCIRIHYAETHNIVIDSGVMRFSPNFKRICDGVIQNRETLDALILTHVDTDHIGGILTNLRSANYTCPFNEVWMNHSAAAVANATNLEDVVNQFNLLLANMRAVGLLA